MGTSTTGGHQMRFGVKRHVRPEPTQTGGRGVGYTPGLAYSVPRSSSPCPPVARRHDLDVDWRTIALVAGQLSRQSSVADDHRRWWQTSARSRSRSRRSTQWQIAITLSVFPYGTSYGYSRSTAAAVNVISVRRTSGARGCIGLVLTALRGPGYLHSTRAA